VWFYSKDAYASDPRPYLKVIYSSFVPSWGVDVTVLPKYQSGALGATLDYTVTVTNAGTENDNYALTVIDNENWVLLLSENWFENVQSSESRIATLSVTIPDNVALDTKDNIIVIATSQENNTVSDNDSCIAHAAIWAGTATFELNDMYNVRLEKDLWIYTGSKLVVKFYTYGDVSENENVIENFSPPWHVVENENARHPEGIGVKKVRLDLTTDDTENVISTIATFTVTRDSLAGRLVDIYMEWPFASLARRNELNSEIVGIYLQWPFAPT